MNTENNSREKIAALIVASHNGTITPLEKEELEAWLSESEVRRLFYDQFFDEEATWNNLRWMESFDSIHDWEQLKSKSQRKKRRLLQWVSSAAAVFLLTIAGWGLWYQTRQTENREVTTITSYAITPGSSKARLTIDPETRIDFGENKLAALPLEELSLRMEKNELIYETERSEPIQWHTLEVPRGGEFQLRFSDGSRVILNAASSLRFPSRFEGDYREVEISGEAFFEIATDRKHPFVVKYGDSRVVVTGTSFNLRAYPGESSQTTLVSGKVSVFHQDEEVSLHPGDQISCDENGYTIRQVDVSSYLSWNDQRFIFEDELLEDVMKKLERWYDIQVVILNPSILNTRYTGNLSKYEDLNNVLEILGLTTSRVQYTLRERILFVNSK